MIGRKAIVALTAAAALAGCAMGPKPAKPQDVEFLRGCWVMKTQPGGEVYAFLRLLPPSPGAKTYDGHIEAVKDGATQEGTRFSIARDGSSLVRSGASGPWASGRYDSYVAPLPNAATEYSRKAAVFLHDGAAPTQLVAEVRENERLRIVLQERTNETTLVEFEGERDGCD